MTQSRTSDRLLHVEKFEICDNKSNEFQKWMMYVNQNIEFITYLRIWAHWKVKQGTHPLEYRFPVLPRTSTLRALAVDGLYFLWKSTTQL